ncbi:MAG: prolyl oligopeptidase family serine peptidase [Candidatus Aminicenantia bacterium]
MRRRKNILFFMILLLFPFQLFCFTIEEIMKAPFPSGLISCNSKDRIAWVFNIEGKRNIWIADAPSWTPRQVTSYNEDDGKEISELSFSPDGSIVVYVLGGSPNRQGESPNPTSNSRGAKQEIWAVNLEDGRIWLLGEGSHLKISPAGDIVAFLRQGRIFYSYMDGSRKSQPLFFSRGRITNFAFSPDGEKIAFESMREDHSFIGIFHIKSNSIKWLSPSIERDTNPVWSKDGKYIAFFRFPGGERSSYFAEGSKFSIMVCDTTNYNCWEAWKCPDSSGGFAQTYPSQPLLWSDERIIFYSEHDGWLHLYSVPYKGGDAVCLTPGEFEVEYIAPSPDGKRIYFNSNKNDMDRRHIWSVSTSGGDLKQITYGRGIEWAPVISSSGKFLIYICSTAYQPASLAYVELSSLKQRLITENLIPKEFPKSQLVEPQQVIFTASDGLKIHGQLFLPKTLKKGEKLPAVIYLHGGPIRQMLLGWHYYSYYHNAYAFNQYLVSKGYVVLSVNFRSGIGYGKAFRAAPNQGPRGASEYQDVVAGAKYLQTREYVDPLKIGLWGGSYGGYLTALGLARNSDLFACGVDLHGVHDWALRARRRDGGGWEIKEDEYKIAYDSSPIASVFFWKSPVLFVHGDDDRNVDFIQTTILVQKLRELNKAHVEVLVLPDEVHSFLMHKSWIEVFKKSFDFFERFLKSFR